MLTISKLAAKFGLSRSTLLYYGRMGLLSPSARTAAGYRLYSEADERRLATICEFRQAGVALEKIRTILGGRKSDTVRILEERLFSLNAEINNLRRRQQLILDLLGSARLKRGARVMDKDTWVDILRATGLSDEDMDQWHREFESQAPEAHQDFLESLGFTPDQIRLIRRTST